MGGTIVKLDEYVTNQIRSHTIINSIDQVIKELLQNSLDANATDILIKLDLSSLSIYIQDNGHGISPSDLEKVTLQNHTSKSDHPNNTFGYKGEALFALDAVSKLTIVSKIKEYNAPYKLVSTECGRVAQIFDRNDTSGFFQIGDLEQSGTIVIANLVFNNIPVRKQQILRTPTYKLLESIKVAILESLIKNPRIKLEVLLINHEKYQLDEVVSLNNKYISSSYSTMLFKLFKIKVKYEPVCAKFRDIKITGIIGTKPVITKKHQYVFINNKLFDLSSDDSTFLNNLFGSAGFNAEEGGSITTKTPGKPFYKYPTFLIKVKCLRNQSIWENSMQSNTWDIILKMMERMFQKFLETKGYDVLKRKNWKNTPSPFPSPTEKQKGDNFILNTKVKLGKLHESELNGLVSNHQYAKKKIQPLPIIPSKMLNSPKPTISHCLCHDQEYNFNESLDFTRDHLLPGNYKIINQIDKKFIMMTLKEEQMRVVILDQHASDERIKVEEFYREFVDSLQNNPGLRLQSPLSFELNIHESSLFEQYHENFNTFGINYQIVDGSVITVTHLPLILLNKINSDVHFLKDSLIQHVYDLNDHIKKSKVNLQDWFETSYHLPRIIIELLNSKACRSAIMFGDELTMDDMHRLVDGLSRCRLPFQCAHGRPSIVPLAKIE
ncbi:MLH3 DNA mismatch repair protein MLH3 [Candida maltosa Xu316]|uniref:MutL C-terminal dimerisation domain-containing protein n=1 Tax=Candida maltosa (strain Xu316) TaxID=1245528 RepID=M3ITS8_CANMX|nr:hypothetical protein G210_4990 [Candida maltosa Xu316]